MAGEIVSAALHARREDQRLIAEARTGLDQAAREVGNRLASARRGDVQNRWLIGTGLGGAALGMLLYAALAGPVARMMPASWHRSEEHTSELQSLMRISYAVFCLKKKNKMTHT